MQVKFTQLSAPPHYSNTLKGFKNFPIYIQYAERKIGIFIKEIEEERLRIIKNN
jgi:hypothetical protein